MRGERAFDPAFADREDFSGPEATAETVAKLGEIAERIRALLPDLPESETARRGTLEVTNFKDFLFVTPHTPPKSGETFGVEFYTEAGERRVMENTLADFIYYAPDEERREVHITIKGDSLLRGDVDRAEREAADAAFRQGGAELGNAIANAGSREEAKEAVLRIAPDVGEHLARSDAKRKEAEAFEEMTGMNKVSEETAQQLLHALKVVEQELYGT